MSGFLGSRDRRALMLGALVAVPALLYLAAIKPYIASMRRVKERIETQRELLRREKALVAAAPRLPGLINAAREALAAEAPRLYLDRDPVAATAALSRDVNDALRNAGVAVQRVEAHDAAQRSDGLRELTLDVRAEGDLEGILSAIASLEAGDKLIRVSRIGLDRGPIAPQSGTEALAWTAVIHGYSR